MIHKDDAARILQEVRAFYAAGVKSANKAYITGVPNDQTVDINDPFDDKWQDWSTAMMAQKAEIRNNNVLESQQNRPPGPKGGSFHEFGKRIYNGGKRAEFTSGNCMEMAAVAAAIAIDSYHFESAWLFIAAIGAPGDHGFCMLSMREPTWRRANEMVKGSSTSVAYVIDPWLNTACAANEYWEAAQAKVKKWANDGKRVAWRGMDGKQLGWYCPDSAYSLAFGTSPLSFIPIDKKI
jgi:hypothetical protein